MPPVPSRAAALLRRAVPVAVLAAALTAPAAHAADSLGAGGVVVPGSALAVGVSGATNQAGKLSARFSAVGSPLFWGSNTSNMNDTSAAVFALNTPSGLYSPQSEVPVDNAPFTQTQAPALTGTGTPGDPYVVVSKYDANPGVHITQTVTHVSGTTRFTATWAVTNGTGSPSNFQGFEAADMYVNGNDNGTGTKTGSAPNRVLGSVASDGTQGQLVEQAVSPWTHYFTGMNSPYYNATGDSTYGSFPDTVDPTLQDSGEGVEWDFTLANGATKTMSVVWNFTHPALPQAPRITGGVPAANATTQATSVSPAFTYAVGDSANAVGFQCAIDGGSFSTCASPKSYSGLADGSHTVSIRATNSAGDPGPQTDRTFTVDTTPPGAPVLTGAPTGTVATDSASIAIAGEVGATLKCSVDGGAYATCTSPLSLLGLADGNHTVSVKQVDPAGNAGSLVATASWTVDTSVPARPVPTTPPADSTSTSTAVEFTVGTGETSECSLDGAAFAACSSPLTLNGLSRGAHELKVRGVSSAGTRGAERSFLWTVRAPATPAADVPATAADTPATPAAQADGPAAATVPAGPTGQLVSRRVVTLHWRLPAGAKAKGYEVVVDGVVVQRLRGGARKARVSFVGRPAATTRVEVRTTGSARVLHTVRTYRIVTGDARKGSRPDQVLRPVR